MKTLPVTTFNELAPAAQLQTRLLQAGVQAVIHDESKLERFWFMSEQLAAIHVRVPESDYLNAQRLLGEWENSTELLRAAVRCPDCRSSRVEFPQGSRKSLLPTAGQTVLMLLHVLPREYYCMDCHCTWSKQASANPELDLLNWPVKSKFWHPEEPRQPEK